MKKFFASVFTLSLLVLPAFAEYTKVAQGIYYSNYNPNSNGFSITYRYTKEAPQIAMLFKTMSMAGLNNLSAFETDFKVDCQSGMYTTSNVKYFDSNNNIIFNSPESKTESIQNKPEIQAFCSALRQNR